MFNSRGRLAHPENSPQNRLSKPLSYITLILTIIYLKNTPILAPFRNRLIPRLSRDQLRSLYNICTILVQYLYVYNCTSIVQLLYIYCTTTSVGGNRIGRFCNYFLLLCRNIKIFFRKFADCIFGAQFSKRLMLSCLQCRRPRKTTLKD